MKFIPKKIYSVLYRLTGWIFPDSYLYITIFNIKIHVKLGLYYRRFLVKHIINNCGNKINIERFAKFNKNITIGDYSGIGKKCSVAPFTKIGKHVMMGPEVIMYSRNHKIDRTDIPMADQGFMDFNPITIEDDVWIGRRVIILPGVTIGKGSVIGAGSVVAKNIPPYSVAVGNPVKVIRNRKK
jgi:maltose O-acetyltransferase